MGYSIVPMKFKDPKVYGFWTIERDPEADASAGKRKLLDFLGANMKFARDASGMQMCKVVSETSTKGYCHYHIITKTADPKGVKHKAILNKMKKHMKFEKKNKSGVSAWLGQARQHDDNVWEDWNKYIGMAAEGRLHKKGKEFDQDGAMTLEFEPIYEEFLQEQERNPTISLQYISKIDGEKRGLFSFM